MVRSTGRKAIGWFSPLGRNSAFIAISAEKQLAFQPKKQYQPVNSYLRPFVAGLCTSQG
jgi:hypothetical protein